MAYEHIAYDVKDRILTITLDRPEQLNAFTGTMQNELIDGCDRADADDDIRVIIPCPVPRPADERLVRLIG